MDLEVGWLTSSKSLAKLFLDSLRLSLDSKMVIIFEIRAAYIIPYLAIPE